MCLESSRAEEMSKGEWDNQALAVKTATHSRLSDSTREIFQTCQLLHMSNGREKDAPEGGSWGQLRLTGAFRSLTGHIQCGEEGHLEGQQQERKARETLSRYECLIKFPLYEISAQKTLIISFPFSFLLCGCS